MWSTAGPAPSSRPSRQPHTRDSSRTCTDQKEARVQARQRFDSGESRVGRTNVRGATAERASMRQRCAESAVAIRSRGVSDRRADRSSGGQGDNRRSRAVWPVVATDREAATDLTATTTLAVRDPAPAERLKSALSEFKATVAPTSGPDGIRLSGHVGSGNFNMNPHPVRSNHQRYRAHGCRECAHTRGGERRINQTTVGAETSRGFGPCEGVRLSEVRVWRRRVCGSNGPQARRARGCGRRVAGARRGSARR
jgi:hypothetical protein